MRKVVFDNSFLTLVFNPKAKASIPKASELVDDLIESLQDEGAKIIIPTPVLTEVLIKARASGPTYIEKLKPYACFQIKPFDEKSAIELAEILVASVGRVRTRKDLSQVQITFDRQIVAVAKVHGATTVYSDDENVKAFARECGISGLGFSDIKLRPKQKTLDLVPDDETLDAEGSE